MSNSKSLYPRVFVTPGGRFVSIRTMANALSTIRKDRFKEVHGWEWYSVPGHMILNEFRRGLNDRINRRALKGNDHG